MQWLSFLEGRHWRLQGNYTTPKSLHGRWEWTAGSSADLKEHGGHDLTLQTDKGLVNKQWIYNKIHTDQILLL